ncbi:MAG: hydrogenase/urease maturation nickel metallochaperone HypA [Acidimicrobiales bacterium]|jgi:Zn finger protein HypA/HybF involved in hydrogenase expression
MHELSLVAELVEECCRRADGEAVSLVRVRCCLPDLGDELQQAFLMMTTATPLEGAVLEIEETTLQVACPCGYFGPVHNGIVGHMFVCPECAQVGPINSSGLELLEVRN